MCLFTIVFQLPPHLLDRFGQKQTDDIPNPTTGKINPCSCHIGKHTVNIWFPCITILLHPIPGGSASWHPITTPAKPTTNCIVASSSYIEESDTGELGTAFCSEQEVFSKISADKKKTKQNKARTGRVTKPESKKLEGKQVLEGDFLSQIIHVAASVGIDIWLA